MWKSESAWPGARRTFLIRPIRRSELMNVPSFSPHAGRGQEQVGERGGLGRVVHVLHDQEVEPGRGSRGVALVDPGVGRVGGDDPEAADLALANPVDDLVVGPARPRRGCGPRGCRAAAATSARWAGSVKSRPPSRFVVFEKSREPIALHWPVIELAPVPGRPMLPVMSARLMIAWAVLTPWWLWLTPIVHQNETRLPSWIRAAASSIASAPRPVS